MISTLVSALGSPPSRSLPARAELRCAHAWEMVIECNRCRVTRWRRRRFRLFSLAKLSTCSPPCISHRYSLYGIKSDLCSYLADNTSSTYSGCTRPCMDSRPAEARGDCRKRPYPQEYLRPVLQRSSTSQTGVLRNDHHSRRSVVYACREAGRQSRFDNW